MKNTMQGDNQSEDSPLKALLGLLEGMTEEVAQPSNDVLGVDCTSLLKLVDDLVNARLGLSEMAKTHETVAQIMLDLNEVVNTWLAANTKYKSQTSVGKWAVYGRCVERVGETVRCGAIGMGYNSLAS